MTTILVLGASGFLGSHVCKAIENQPDAQSWVGVARRPPPRRPPNEMWKAIDLVAAPVTAYEQLLTEIRPSVVINCVGVTTGSFSLQQEINVEVVQKLVVALGRHEGPRLIHFGSAAEYGPQPTADPVPESALPQPSSPYGVTKLAATTLVVSAIERQRIQGTVFRVFNPVGARAPETTLAGRAARAMYQAMTTGQSSITLGALDVYRDFVAAEDVGTAATLAVRTPQLPPIINFGRGVAMSAAALVTLLQDVASYDGEIIEMASGSPRSSQTTTQCADVAVLQAALGWVPSTPLASAVAALWTCLLHS
jgi:NDP-hexose 4-ketoreductase